MIIDWIMDIFAKVQWEWLKEKLTGRRFNLYVVEDWERIRQVLSKGYFIILTYKNAHLSTWAVRGGHLALTGKLGSYSHALVNVEPDRYTYQFDDFIFVEAVGVGVKYSKWDEVMNCDGICILKPKYWSIDEINECGLETVYSEIGKKYDKRLKYNDPAELSCVEVARATLKRLPGYEEKMRVFEFMIQNEKNLTPQMFRDCPDFEVLLEIKR